MSDVLWLMERWSAMGRAADPAMEQPPTAEQRRGYVKAFEMFGINGEEVVNRLGCVLAIKNELQRYLQNQVPEVLNEAQPNERQVDFFKKKTLNMITDQEMADFMKLTRREAREFFVKFETRPTRPQLKLIDDLLSQIGPNMSPNEVHYWRTLSHRCKADASNVIDALKIFVRSLGGRNPR